MIITIPTVLHVCKKRKNDERECMSQCEKEKRSEERTRLCRILTLSLIRLVSHPLNRKKSEDRRTGRGV